MMKVLRIATVVLGSLLAFQEVCAQEIEIVEMRPPQGVEQAHFHFVKLHPNPQGLLVLVPGFNGSPTGLISNAKWRELAQKHQLDIVGCHFKGNPNGPVAYQRPAQGSGRSLTDAIKQVYKKDLPMAMYGFSAGAQYTSRFIDLNPRRITVWAAYGAGSVDPLKGTPNLPPGVVLCGEQDTTRYSLMRGFYNDGRSKGYRWAWVSVPNSAHTTTPAALDFIHAYMDEVLSGNRYSSSQQSGVWMNLEDGSTSRNSTRKPEFSWLPSDSLVAAWKLAAGKGE